MIDAGHWCQRRRRSNPSTRLPIRLVNSRQVGPPASLAACCPDHLAQHRHRGLPTSCLAGYLTPPSSPSIGIGPRNAAGNPDASGNGVFHTPIIDA